MKGILNILVFIFFIFISNLDLTFSQENECKSIEHCLKCPHSDKCEECEQDFILDRENNKCITKEKTFNKNAENSSKSSSQKSQSSSQKSKASSQKSQPSSQKSQTSSQESPKKYSYPIPSASSVKKLSQNHQF